MRSITKVFFILLTAFSLSVATSSAVPDLEIPTAIDLINSTVRIRTAGGQGSGEVIWTGISDVDSRVRLTYVLTNRHVVGNHENVEIDKFIFLKERNSVGTTTYEASVAFVSTECDMALIEIQTPPESQFSTVSFISQEDWDQIRLYEPVFLVSCGLGTSPYVTNGNLSSVNREETRMEFTACIIFGSSGGGIYNSEGELIGIGNAVRVARMRGLHPVPHRAIGIPMPTLVKVINQTRFKFILEEDEDEDDEDDEAPPWPEGWPDFPGLDDSDEPNNPHREWH